MPDPKKDQNNQEQNVENINPVVEVQPELKKHLEETEKMLHEQEEVLNLLKKKQADLLEYDQTQTELMENRQREIDVFDYSKRETFKENIRTSLPQNVVKYNNMKEKEKNKITPDLDKALAAEKEKQDKNVYINENNKLKVNSIREYNDLEKEVESIRNEIKKDEKSLSESQMAWYKNTTDTIALKKADLSNYQYFYEDNKKIYGEKQKAFEEEYAESTKTERWNEEYAEFQSMLARRIMIKNVIKKAAMDKDSVESFRDLDKLKKEDKDQYQIKHAVIGMKMVQASYGDPRLKELGYDDPNKANNALDEYYALEDKINRFYPRMEKFGTKDQKNWIHAHNATKVSKFFNPDGTLKQEYSEFKDLSNAYDPQKNTIERRDRIMQERNDARFDYFQSAQSLRLNQRDVINKTIEDENKRIDEHNKQERKNARFYGSFSNQKSCDAQFLKDVEDRANEAAKTRRKMVVGSVVTGFAAQIMSSVAGMATKAGTIAAEGIVKGETVQMEKELEALKKEQEKQIEASVSAVKNTEADKVKASELSKENDAKKRDEALFKIVESNKHSMKGLEAENRASELQKKIEEKQVQLEKQREVEKEKLADIENKISGKQFADNEKKLEQNKRRRDENAITELANSLEEAQRKLKVVNIDPQKNDVIITDDVLDDLMHAKTQVRSEDLSREEKEILKKDADLKAQLKTMQGYSEKIKNLLTPDNIGKVDTIVSICETLYSAYSTASKFINGQAGDEKNDEKKDGDKKDENKDGDKKEDAKGDEKENEEEDNYELNIISTIQGLKDKAKAISDSMNGKGEKEDNGTIVGNITDLTLEAGQIVSIVSKKIEDMTAGMEVSLEEARAREEVEKDFLQSAKMKSGKSPVFSAKDELTQQQALHKRVMERDLDANKTAIEQQEEVVKGVRETRDKLLKDLQIYEQHQEEERKKKIEEEVKKAEEEKRKREEEDKKKQAQIPDTEEIAEARKAYEDAVKKEAEVREKKAKAEDAFAVAVGKRDILKKDFDTKNSQLEHYTKAYQDQLDEAKRLQDQNGKSQKDKQKDLIDAKENKASEAKSAIRKTAVKSFFVNIASTAAEYSKGFVDQMSIGFAEAVVKGKVKQMEDELAEKENIYRKKGETALAKDRSRLQHVKKAQNIANAGKKTNQLLNEMISDATIVENDLKTLESTLQAPKDQKQKFEYNEELKKAARAEQASKDLQKERVEIKEEIKKMQEDIAAERVKEQEKLDELHEELKKAYGIDPNAARKIDIDTAANKAKAMVALKQIEEKMKVTQDPIEIFTSPAFSETDAAQREVIKQEVRNLKLDKDVEAKGQRLEKISNQLKGLFTPKNMGRVDTVVSAAETLYSLYGSVKGFIDGNGGGDDKEAEEEEKNIAGKIKDIKEKATSVRKGMIGEGEPSEDEPKIVENLMSITQSMREITDVVSTKIAKIAKEYEIELDTQREIKISAEREKKELQAMFKADANLKLPEAIDKFSTNPKNIVIRQSESMKLSKEAHDKSLQEVDEARDAYNKQVKDLEDSTKDTKDKKEDLEKKIAEEIKRRKEQEERERIEKEERIKREREEQERKERQEREAQERKAEQERAEREQKARAEREERARNDAKMSSLGDILDNLKDTGKGYFNHKNTDEFKAVVNQLQDFIDKKDKNITFKPEQTKDLQDALTAYLEHTGMKTAWHESGNIRKDNVLAALNLINPDKAKEYEMKANSVRRESKKINLNTLMEKEGVRRSPDRKRRAEAQKEEPQKVNNANERRSGAHSK